MKDYSDLELIQILEENNKKVSFKNIEILKENLKNGNITLTEDDKSSEEEIKITPEDNKTETEEKIESKKHGYMTNKVKKQFIKENFSNQTNYLLKSYLTEDCGMKESEYLNLNEDAKTASIKEITINLLNTIQEKLLNIDTLTADKSRGDIKLLRELPAIQDSITQLETVLERNENFVPEAKNYLDVVIKSILYINQYSQVFKDAYRNKSILMIMKYQSLILSIIASVAYLMSAIIDVTNGNIEIKKNIIIEEIGQLKTLSDFNDSVDSGEFKKITRDIVSLREHYLEVPVETMGKLLEAPEILPVILNTVKNFASNLSNNGKLLNLIYKATGSLVILFSLRDSLYSFVKMKTKITDIANSLSTFADINLPGAFSKLSQFVSKFKTDAEVSSELAHREIESENKQILTTVKNVQSSPAKIEAPTEIEVQKDNTSNNNVDDFLFDF